MEHGGDDLLAWQCSVDSRQAIDPGAGVKIAHQIFRALAFMHSANIIHRDLKPANIAVSLEHVVKILDFGLARNVTTHNAGSLTGYLCTRYYRAPELMFRGTNYTSAVDIWSVGCILAELVTTNQDEARILFHGDNELQHMRQISAVIGKPSPEYIATIESDSARGFVDTFILESARRKLADLPYFEGVDAVAIDLLEQIFVYEPENRISATEALQHPFFRGRHDRKDVPEAEISDGARGVGGAATAAAADDITAAAAADDITTAADADDITAAGPIARGFVEGEDAAAAAADLAAAAGRGRRLACIPADAILHHKQFGADFEEVDTDVAGWLSKCKQEVEEFNRSHTALPSSPTFDPTSNPIDVAETFRACRQAARSSPEVQVKFVHQDDPENEFSVNFTGGMDFNQCKAALLGGAHVDAPVDMVAVYSRQTRVTCDYTSLAKHAAVGSAALMLVTNLEPSQRAEEMNDTIQHHWWLQTLQVLLARGDKSVRFYSSGAGDMQYRRILFEDADIMDAIMENPFSYERAASLLDECGWQLKEAHGCWELIGRPELLKRKCTAELAQLRHQETGRLVYMPADAIFRKNGRVHFNGAETTMIGAELCETWKITRYLMSGTFGHGFEATDTETGEQRVFVKIFRCNADRDPRKSREWTEPRETATRKEIAALMHPAFQRATDHASVTSNTVCFGPVVVPDTGAKGEMFFMVTADFCECGELFDVVCPRTAPYLRPFREAGARRLFRQLAQGIAHMHANGCYHRDLKMENLVLTSDPANDYGLWICQIHRPDC